MDMEPGTSLAGGGVWEKRKRGTGPEPEEEGSWDAASIFWKREGMQGQARAKDLKELTSCD